MKLFNAFHREKDDLILVILRFGMGSSFLWFGIDKWVHPDMWFGWVPLWLWQYLPVTPTTLMYIGGTIEFAVGILLVAGKLIGPAALAGSVLLLNILVFTGANEVTVRDMGLLGGCLALLVHADAVSKRPLPRTLVANVVGLYVFMLFIVGVLYLKSGT